MYVYVQPLLAIAYRLSYKSKIIQLGSLNVTVHAKTSLARTRIEIHFLPQLIATHISYLHSMSPMTRLNWSAFLRGRFTTL